MIVLSYNGRRKSHNFQLPTISSCYWSRLRIHVVHILGLFDPLFGIRAIFDSKESGSKFYDLEQHPAVIDEPLTATLTAPTTLRCLISGPKPCLSWVFLHSSI